MTINLYDTLEKRKKQFKPLGKDFVRMYDCGPTVYSYPSIGNMWRYLVSDYLRRILELNGYKVKQVLNITDVGHLTEDDLLAADTGEDKIEKAAKKEGKTPKQIADFYTKVYFEDRRKLNILDPTVVTKATEYVPQMIKMIEELVKKGYAYELPDRVCFDVGKFKSYGKLSGKSLDQLKAGVRLEPIKGKKSPYDFSLWIKDEKHLMRWDSPWGEGYPGWHIECSAMSLDVLGEKLDIHTGGEDNIFPHHENEIAQSESFTDKKFVNFWVHIRFMLVNGEKMGKSKGNYYLLKDLEKEGFDVLAFRYLTLSNHYSSPLNFTFQSLKNAQKALNRLRLTVWRLKKDVGPEDKPQSGSLRTNLLEKLNNDIGTPQALAYIWDILDSDTKARDKLELVTMADKVFGLNLLDWNFSVPKEIIKLADMRNELRSKGEYGKADKLREEIKRKGWLISDTSGNGEVFPDLDDHND